MQSFRLGLGVQCDFCHVKGDFASDENPKKDIARKMIVLAQDVNAKFSDGKEHVTCYTCHRGAQEPKTAAASPVAREEDRRILRVPWQKCVARISRIFGAKGR